MSIYKAGYDDSIQFLNGHRIVIPGWANGQDSTLVINDDNPVGYGVTQIGIDLPGTEFSELGHRMWLADHSQEAADKPVRIGLEEGI